MEGRRGKKGKKTKQMDAIARSRKNWFRNFDLTFMSVILKTIRIASASLPCAGLGRNCRSSGGSAPPTGAGLASSSPKLTLIWRRDPARHPLQRRGFAIRHVGWSFCSGRETGVTSWAPRQLHSCSGESLSLSLQRLRPTGAGLGWIRVGPRLACLLGPKGSLKLERIQLLFR